MAQIIRPDVLTGTPTYAGEPLPIAQAFVEKVNEVRTTGTDDVVLQTLEASVLAIATLELRILALMKAVGAEEVRPPTINLGKVRGDDAPQ